MTDEEYELALKSKPDTWEVLVRKIDKKFDGFDEKIWGKFPTYLLCICLRVPSQNYKVEYKQGWKTVFIFLSPEPNEVTRFHKLLRQLYMWKCVNPRGRKDNCSRVNGMQFNNIFG